MAAQHLEMERIPQNPNSRILRLNQPEPTEAFYKDCLKPNGTAWSQQVLIRGLNITLEDYVGLFLFLKAEIKRRDLQTIDTSMTEGQWKASDLFEDTTERYAFFKRSGSCKAPYVWRAKALWACIRLARIELKSQNDEGRVGEPKRQDRVWNEETKKVESPQKGKKRKVEPKLSECTLTVVRRKKRTQDACEGEAMNEEEGQGEDECVEILIRQLLKQGVTEQGQAKMDLNLEDVLWASFVKQLKALAGFDETKEEVWYTAENNRRLQVANDESLGNAIIRLRREAAARGGKDVSRLSRLEIVAVDNTARTDEE